MTTDDATFWKNAHAVLRDIGMPHLDPAHGAAVEVVRWCLAVRGRPTHRRQAFLEMESPALLVYLETLAATGDAAGWRTLEQRIRLHAEVLRGTEPYLRPWKAAIWHVLPELAAMGQAFLDRQAENSAPAPETVHDVTNANANASDDADGGGDKGSGKTGSGGTTSAPRPRLRLALPPVPVVLTGAKKKALDLDNDTSIDDKTDAAPEGPNGADGDGGTSGPGGMGGRR
jgi:hypothetical protein